MNHRILLQSNPLWLKQVFQKIREPFYHTYIGAAIPLPNYVPKEH